MKNTTKRIKMNICENCNHFFQTAMARIMSNGNAGYCSLIQNDPNNNRKTKDGIRTIQKNAIKQKTFTCLKFNKTK